jgi:hypothetical protein
MIVLLPRTCTITPGVTRDIRATIRDVDANARGVSPGTFGSNSSMTPALWTLRLEWLEPAAV